MSDPTLFLTARSGAFVFQWDLVADQAQLRRAPGNEVVWTGNLLPFFWVTQATGEVAALHATARHWSWETNAQERGTLHVDLGDIGTGELLLSVAPTGMRFEQLTVQWQPGRIPAIHSLYFGASLLTPEQRAAAPTLDLPFWPSWRAEGFAVASAKTNPMQSFFRSWDFGHTDLPLGSFGPAMGTPYAAAFPRPTYAACAGGRLGWLCFGTGDVPDAALTFQVRARSGALQWLYREDLWGASRELTRVWKNPLWLTWAETAWDCYRRYFEQFPPATSRPSVPQRSFWGTWGDFRLNQFEWRTSVDRAVDEMEADVICIDDPWEDGKGSCKPHPVRFPTFAADIAYAHQRGIGVGIWMPTGWIEDYVAAGLTEHDLLLGRDGVPVRSNWAVDPRDDGRYFCLDPGAEGARRYLRERTQRVMRDYRPALLKIDFGYGIPGPNACASRDPALRGERLAWTYIRLIADAAKEIDRNVTIMGYSLHPLWAEAQDQISLDDLGDAGAHEATGHRHWSVWATLAAARGTALMGSSGYYWEADTDLLLNSAILGAPGANLPRTRFDGSPAARAQLARRRGLFRWHRNTTAWTPLWLDSALGSLEEESSAHSWGRLETLAGQTCLTALALRTPSEKALAAPELRGLRWTGSWILLAQDDRSIFDTARLAVIPLGAGRIVLPRAVRPQAVEQIFAKERRAHPNWKWTNGLLEVDLDDANVSEPLLGLLIESA